MITYADTRETKQQAKQKTWRSEERAKCDKNLVSRSAQRISDRVNICWSPSEPLCTASVRTSESRRPVWHSGAWMPHRHPKSPSFITSCIHSLVLLRVLLVTKQAHTHTRTHTHPVRVTHPIRETICSTMCLLKVMITNSFCMTKKHTEEEHVSRWTVRSVIAGKAVKHYSLNPLIPPFSHKHSHYSFSPITCVAQPKRFGVKAETKGKKSETVTHVSVSPRLPLEQSVCNVHTDGDMKNQRCVMASEGPASGSCPDSCLVTSTDATNRRLPVIPALVVVGGACRQ